MLRRDNMSPLLWILPLGLFAIGCSAMQLQKPTAAVTGMQVQGVDSNGFTMNFDVDVSNANSVALPLAATDYKIGLAGVNIVQGKAKPEGSIPANGSRSISLPVTLTYENLLAAEQAIVKTGGDVPYALDAGLSLDTGSPLMGSVRVPLKYDGTLKLRNILNDPRMVMQNPAAQKLARQLIGGLFSH